VLPWIVVVVGFVVEEAGLRVLKEPHTNPPGGSEPPGGSRVSLLLDGTNDRVLPLSLRRSTGEPRVGRFRESQVGLDSSEPVGNAQWLLPARDQPAWGWRLGGACTTHHQRGPSYSRA
jgi:hypothetical protein